MPDESYSQDHRLIAVDTPLGKDVLLLQELTGYEGISRLFSYELNLLAYENDSIAFKDIVGQKVSITLHLPDGTPRYISGYVSRFTQGETDERIIHPLPRPSRALALVSDSPGRLPHFSEPGRARHHQPGVQSLRLQGFSAQPQGKLSPARILRAVSRNVVQLRFAADGRVRHLLLLRSFHPGKAHHGAGRSVQYAAGVPQFSDQLRHCRSAASKIPK